MGEETKRARGSLSLPSRMRTSMAMRCLERSKDTEGERRSPAEWATLQLLALFKSPKLQGISGVYGLHYGPGPLNGNARGQTRNNLGRPAFVAHYFDQIPE